MNEGTMNKTDKKFNTRAFVTLMICFSGLGLPITGYANHLYGFSQLTMARHAWMSAHNVLGIFFTIFVVWHVVLNRRALLAYLKNFAASTPFLSRESLLAIVILAMALFLFIGHAFHAGA
jgi:hypothetical protein